MSSIGKVFIVLNALLAAAFLGYSIHALGKTQELVDSKNKAIAQLTSEKETLEKEKSDLQVKVDGEAKAKDAARSESEINKQEAERNRRDLEAQKTDNSKLQGEITKFSTALDGFNTTNKDLIASKEKADQEALAAIQARDKAIAEKDAAETARRNAEDALRTAQANIVNLEKSVAESTRTVDSLSTKLATVVQYTGVDLNTVAAMPQIEGAVLGFDPKLGLVTLNVGSKSGVAPGMTFEIYRAGVYKGQVRVQKALDSMCSALITQPVQGQTIAQGDSASTRL